MECCLRLLKEKGVGGLRIGLASMAPLVDMEAPHKDLYT